MHVSSAGCRKNVSQAKDSCRSNMADSTDAIKDEPDFTDPNRRQRCTAKEAAGTKSRLATQQACAGQVDPIQVS
jgi:hypothetical protein